MAGAVTPGVVRGTRLPVCGPRLPVWLGAGLFLLAALGAGMVATRALPPDRWLDAVLRPTSLDAIIFADATLPRMAAALLAGGLLGLAGAVFQQVLRNPVTTPDTMGVTAGAQLALAVLTLVAPSQLGWGREGVACLGGLGVVGLVLVVTMRAASPGLMLLLGLAATLYAGALTTVLMLFHAHDLSGLLVWAGGSLAVQDWHPVAALAAAGAVLLGLLALMVRPLALFTLDDAMVRAVGGPVTVLRVASLAIAVALTAVVTGLFGVIGFVGLMAPSLARLAGVRRFGPVLGWSAAYGALVLAVADHAAVLGSSWLGIDLPTGAVVALPGAPLLVVLAARSRTRSLERLDGIGARPQARPFLLLALLGLGLAVAVLGALSVGRGATGWTLLLSWDDGAALLPWRVPRTIAAGAAGALLGGAGFLLQRVTGNPVAAPEMLGLSAGATLGLLAATVLGVGAGLQPLFLGAGALLAALALLGWSAATRLEPQRLLVTGLAMMSATGSLVSVFGATGDPRAISVMNWMAGSTSRASMADAGGAAVAALLSLPCLLLAARWLDLMLLGLDSRRGLGLPERSARAGLVVLAAVLTACGTLIVGPVSFVGLVAPRLAAGLGLNRAVSQALGTLTGGALLMVLADTVGRTAAFPWQVPSGLVAALLGSPVLVWLLLRRAA